MFTLIGDALRGRRLFGFLLVLSVSISACSSAPPQAGQPMPSASPTAAAMDKAMQDKFNELLRVYRHPVVSLAAQEYDKQFGENTFALAIIEAGRNAFKLEGITISSGEAVDRLLYSNQHAMRHAVSALQDLCRKSSRADYCALRSTFKIIHSDQISCNKKRAIQCHALAGRLHHNRMLGEALQFAERGCTLGHKTSCGLAKQINSENDAYTDDSGAATGSESLASLLSDRPSNYSSPIRVYIPNFEPTADMR